MFVTNLTKSKLGIDGRVELRPGEENRFVEDTPDLVARVKRLKGAGLVTVKFDEGLVKPEPSKVDVPKAEPVKQVADKVEPAKEVTEKAVEAPIQVVDTPEEEQTAKVKHTRRRNKETQDE
jgi:hypothetical protein